MERAGRVLGKLKFSRQAVGPEDLARSAWLPAVGKKIASHATVVALVRRNLVVEVEDSTWQRQLKTLEAQIVRNLADILGAGIVEGLDLRPMIAPRRGPQNAGVARGSSVPADEADLIADPSLRRAYKISRKRTSA
jgi:predicted nucleic acid-binding Zn ribbon protein